MKPRIMFVDDEEKILQGLKRSLRPLRNEWEVDFAVGGSEALEKMAAAPVDAVVSDMRMPGMDGAELLDRVREAHPATLRFVLSGQCDEESVYRLTANSHQFFGKPCDADHLIAVLRGVLASREAVASGAHRQAVAAAAILPSDSKVLDALRAALDAEAPNLNDLMALVARDPALAAKLMQLVGSAYFGTGSSVTSLRQAIQRLGGETLKRLILRNDLAVPMAETPAAQAIWEQSRARANLAREIARAEGLSEEEISMAGLAGLLLQVGDLLVIESGETLDSAASAALGAHLLSLTGLPRALVDTVAYHARPGEAPEGEEGPQSRLLAVVHAAANLSPAGQSEAPPNLDMAFLDRQGLASRLPDWNAAASGQIGGGDD